MKKPINRKAAVIAAILTVLVLAFAGTAVFAWDRLTGAGASAPTAANTTATQPAVPASVDNGQALALEQANAEIAAYKAQLEQASQALNDAYAQITSLQAAQNQPGLGQNFGEHEGREHERVFTFQGGGND